MKRASDHLELELQLVLKHSKRVLELNSGLLEVGSALDCSVTSLAPTDDTVAEVLVLSACACQYSAAGGGAFVWLSVFSLIWWSISFRIVPESHDSLGPWEAIRRIYFTTELLRLDWLPYIHGTYFLETQAQHFQVWARRQPAWSRGFPVVRENTGVLLSNVPWPPAYPLLLAGTLAHQYQLCSRNKATLHTLSYRRKKLWAAW